LRHDPPFLSAVAADARRFLDTWGKVTPMKVARLALLTPGFQFALSIRLQSALRAAWPFGRPLARVLWYVSTAWFGSDVDPGASFGPGLYAPHPHGIVVGGECRVGAGATILQNVTMGRKVPDAPSSPVIGDNVSIFAGAVVAGGVRVGDGAVVGANAVVLADVPPGHTALGVPARICVIKETVTGKDRG
jgi:serine O-acetyltransferase